MPSSPTSSTNGNITIPPDSTSVHHISPPASPYPTPVTLHKHNADNTLGGNMLATVSQPPGSLGDLRPPFTPAGPQQKGDRDSGPRRFQPMLSSKSSTHLLTPHSPGNNAVYQSTRGHETPSGSSPSTSTPNSSFMMLGQSGPRPPSPTSQPLGQPFYHKPRLEEKRTANTALQLTPNSSPMYIQNQSRYHRPGSPTPPPNNRSSGSLLAASSLVSTQATAPSRPNSSNLADSSQMRSSQALAQGRGTPEHMHYDAPTQPLLPPFGEASPKYDYPEPRTPLTRSFPGRSSTPIYRMRSAHPQHGSPGPSSPAGARFDGSHEDVFGGGALLPRRSSPASGSTTPTSTSTRRPATVVSADRIPGGEMHRIRTQRIEQERARHAQTERKRPDYMKRVSSGKHGPSNIAVVGEEIEARPAPEGHYALGIAFSPVKGRRIQLVRPASPATGSFHTPQSSFHLSPTTLPERPPTSSVTLKWLQSAPLTPRNEARPAPTEASVVEKESKKRKRLAAFLEDSRPLKKSPLQPVELDQLGRMVVHPEDIIVVNLPVTPQKKRPARRKGGRRAVPVSAPDKRVTVFGLNVKTPPILPPALEEMVIDPFQDVTFQSPMWPDGEFPWSEDGRMRALFREDVDNERMRLVERFLDTATDDEDPDDLMDSPDYTPAEIVEEDEERPHHPPGQGKGKTVLVNTDPEQMARSVAVYTDPGDARAALFAKRHVRALVWRTQEGVDVDMDMDGDGGVVACVCRGKLDDDRPMVQCDSCRKWSHQSCVGIQDESDLGAEWYCWNCQQLAPEPEPTFTLKDESPRPRINSTLNLYDPQSLTSSPMLPGQSPRRDTMDEHEPPVTPQPNRRSAMRPNTTPQLRLPPAWEDSEDGKTPKTPIISRPPIDMKDYRTPKFFAEFESSGQHDVFDPSSTPSRGLRLGGAGGSFSSGSSDVRGSRSWTAGLGQPPITPDQPRFARFGQPSFPRAGMPYFDESSPLQQSNMRTRSFEGTSGELSTQRQFPQFGVLDLDSPTKRPGIVKGKGKEPAQDFDMR